MKSCAIICRTAATILIFVALAVGSRAEAAAGRTVGNYAVSWTTGAATYTIPIWAPRGPNGLQPQIALSYNSQSSNGYLGVGWSISGLSSIYRCIQTYAQDPAPAPVSLTESDVFCMDGQRLRLTGGTYGVAGSTYQTEIANFSNVTAYDSAGNGPAYFEVKGRDGRTYEYGNGGNSQVLATGTTTAWTWYLDKVTDRAGNTMVISYTTENGSAVPASISWTPTSYGATTYNYDMQFGYGTNVPQSSIYGYVGGTPFSNTALLTSISVNYTGTTVKKYSLSYGQSPTTSRDELTQVQECADAGGTNCLSPTQFTYQNGQVGVSTTVATGFSGAFNQLKLLNDFNGDGLKDLAYCNNGSPSTIYVAVADGSDSPVNTEIQCKTPLYGDLTGSGKDGILAPNGADWWYYTWNGGAELFSGQDTGLAYDSTVSQYILADVNGDGLPDLIESKVTSSGLTLYIRLNTSSGTAASFSSTSTVGYSDPDPNITGAEISSNTEGQYGDLRRLDFNGDGRDDLSYERHETLYPKGGEVDLIDTFELISTGGGFTSVHIARAPETNYVPIAFLNFNSDACTDYVLPGTASADNEIYISGCDGSLPETISFGPIAVIGAMDWDGDGRTDILVQNGSTIGVYLSDGDGISSLQSTSIPYAAANDYFAFDTNGDGLDDLAAVPASGTGTVTYQLHNAVGQKPDLLASVVDGYANSVQLRYQSLIQCSSLGYDAQYPYENYLGRLYVVTNATFSDPSNQPNGTYQQLYGYERAWMNLQGRGFAGFGWLYMSDSRNQMQWDYFYDRAFPYTGMLLTDDACYFVVGYGSKCIYNRKYALASTALDTTQYNQRYFTYASNVTQEDYGVGGLDDQELIATTGATYGYDNYGNLTSAITTVTDNDSYSPYDGSSWTETITNTPDVSASTWCLGLLSEHQIAYTASDGSPSVTRTQTYSPDTTDCRYTQITTEPSSNSYRVTEALGYDSFGNVSSDTMTGAGMAARQTTASWGPTGQFPMSVTDATGHATLFNYDFRYGLVSSETDPNQLTTSWQYGEGFGRPTKEIRPDGTYTLYYYSPCDSGNTYCRTSQPDLRLFVQNKYYGSDGAEIDERDLYENAVDEIRYNTIYNISGKVYVVTDYDALGRVVARSVPHIGTEYDTTYSYDVLNRVTQTQRPVSQTDSTLQTTSYAYQGDTTTITDPNGNSRTLVHDPNGWLRETKDELGYAITLGYDAAGAKTSVTDNLSNGPSNPLWRGTYAYGISPFLIGETDVDRGTWGYTVDAFGERTAWTDPKGQQFHEQYDALSRPVTRTEPDLFTQWTWGSSAASHNIGKLQSLCTGTGGSCSAGFYSEIESYDSLARLSQRSIVIPSMGTYTYTWQYNATTGNIDTLTYPVSTSGQALELKYTYHTGALQSITDVLDSPNVTIWQADAQSPRGQYTQEALGNGLVTNRVYDAVTDWLSSVESGPGGGAAVQNQSFLYDQVGNLTQRQDNNLGLTENFYYDGDNRLSYSTLNGTQNLSLNYDGKGNVTSRSDVASGAAWTYDPTRVHEVTQAGSSAYAYAYDANGNMTSRQGSSITWTSYNYPATISDTAAGESVSFSYGPNRQPWLEKTTSSSGTELEYHVSGLLDIVISGGVTDYKHYIYAGTEPVAIDSRKSSGANALYYLLSDHQGSVVAITNSTGGVLVGESFAAYGNRRNPTTWAGAASSTDLNTIAGVTRHGYTFQEALGSHMGLNDMVGRIQDAITGRFISPDPLIPDPTDPQSYNRYSYTRNNPLTYADPSGFADCDPAPSCPLEPIIIPGDRGPGNAPPGDGPTTTPGGPGAPGGGPGGSPGGPGQPPSQPGSGGTTNPGGSQSSTPALPQVTVNGRQINDSGGSFNDWLEQQLQNSWITSFGSTDILGTLASALPRGAQQTTLQKFKNWLCSAGNSLVSHAEALGSLGLRIEAGGATLTVAGLVGQPEVNPGAAIVTGIGLAGMGTGAAAGTLASIMQVGGGIAQMIGSNDSSVGSNNAFGGSASLATGASTGWATGGSSAMTQGFAGAMGDTAVSMIPGMSSGQAQCGGN